jgi:hypothetical protein
MGTLLIVKNGTRNDGFTLGAEEEDDDDDDDDDLCCKVASSIVSIPLSLEITSTWSCWCCWCFFILFWPTVFIKLTSHL